MDFIALLLFSTLQHMTRVCASWVQIRVSSVLFLSLKAFIMKFKTFENWIKAKLEQVSTNNSILVSVSQLWFSSLLVVIQFTLLHLHNSLYLYAEKKIMKKDYTNLRTYPNWKIDVHIQELYWWQWSNRLFVFHDEITSNSWEVITKVMW